jgi:hypothetical protein
MMKSSPTVFLSLIILVAITACQRTREGEPVSRPEMSQGEIEQLLALGYVDYSKEIATSEPTTEIIEQEFVYPGYTLYVVRDFCRANLIDLAGNIVHSWQAEPCKRWSNAELFPNGNLAVTDGRGRLLWFSWTGKVKWKKALRAHHDLEITPDGKIAVLTRGFRKIPEVSTSHEVNDNVITLLERNREIVGTLSLYDTLSQNSIGFRFLDRIVVKKRIDLIHANSVEWVRPERSWDTRPGSVYEPGNVLVSVRHQDTIVILNWPRKELVWAWGQGVISAQHDASWLRNGNILLFDNGLASKRSRVVEVNPLSREIVWEYSGGRTDPFFSASRGSAQRLPNGNTLVAVSDSGHAFEVTRDGRVVWKFWNPIVDEKNHRATIIRAKRYETKTVERLLARDRSADRP